MVSASHEAPSLKKDNHCNHAKSSNYKQQNAIGALVGRTGSLMPKRNRSQLEEKGKKQLFKTAKRDTKEQPSCHPSHLRPVEKSSSNLIFDLFIYFFFLIIVSLSQKKMEMRTYLNLHLPELYSLLALDLQWLDGALVTLVIGFIYFCKILVSIYLVLWFNLS